MLVILFLLKSNKVFKKDSEFIFCPTGVVVLEGLLYIVCSIAGASNLASVDPYINTWTMLSIPMNIGRS